MARYTGPVCRICRRFGEKLFLKGEKCATKCTLEKRSSPPGDHVARRRRASERGLQLQEKQKVRFTYGVLERQLRRYFADAERRPGQTGENLMQILEMRIDNVVYRLGLAPSRKAARQFVLHGHFAHNGHKHDVPSAILKPGDVVGFRQESAETEAYKQAQTNIQGRFVPPWLSLDPQAMSGRVVAAPSMGDIDVRINEKLIVEYYSR